MAARGICKPRRCEIGDISGRQRSKGFQRMGFAEGAQVGTGDDGQTRRGRFKDVVQACAVTATHHSDGADAVQVEEHARAVDDDNAPRCARRGV